MIKQVILQVFDIKETEFKKTLLLQLLIFLIINTLLIVKPTINSLFLSELTSAALPLGYVLTAIVAVLGSFFYNKALEHHPLNVIIEQTFVGAILSLLLFSVAFQGNLAKGGMVYIPYVWVSIVGLLTASQFWILANLVYNIREAKRVFGFIGAGAIAGGIFGGYLTSILTIFMDSAYLLLVAAGLLFCCIPITRYIWKKEVAELNTFQLSRRTFVKKEPPVALIKQSNLLTYTALVLGLSVLVAKLVDYQFSDYAARFINDPEELTAFFGFWFSTLSLVSLVVQLFLTQWIVGTFGVAKSLLLLPIGIGIGSAVLLFLPELWVVVGIKVVDGSLKQSINKAANELLSIPIPLEIKKKTKTFTDVVVDSIATGLAGFILIFMVNGFNLPSVYVSLIILMLIMLWIYWVVKLRKAYIASFKNLLGASMPKRVKKKKEVKITSTVETVKKILQTGTEKQQVYLLKKTLEVKDKRFFSSIKNLLSHESTKVRALAIDNLYFLNNENLLETIEPMVYDKNQWVTTSAFRYIIKNYPQDRLYLFQKYINNQDQNISNAALISLSLELRNNKALQKQFDLYTYVIDAFQQHAAMEYLEDQVNKLCAILATIGNARMKEFYGVIKEELESPHIIVVNTAIKSAAQTLEEQFIDLLFAKLSNKETRKTAIEALSYYNSPIIDVLYDKLKEENIRLDQATGIITIVENFASQKAVNTLIKLMEDSEYSIKLEAIEALKRLKWKYPKLQIKDRFIVDKILDECDLYQDTLTAIHTQIIIHYKSKKNSPLDTAEQKARNALIQLLEERLEGQLRCIFRFLGIKYPPHDVDTIFHSILHGKEEDRIHAIEFLDNILDMQLKKELIPVTESVLLDTFSEEKIKQLNLKIWSEVECYRELLKRKDIKLKLAILYLLEQVKDSSFHALVEPLQHSHHPKIRRRVAAILQA